MYERLYRTDSGGEQMIESMKNIVVFVRDFEKAQHFYKEQLRLPLVQESMAIMEFFPGGGTTLGISLAMHEAAFPLVGRHTGITLQVKDIETLCRELEEAGVGFAEPLEKTPWGKMAVVKDPDGNQFALVE
jgi:lactoylglutathione lyase